MISRILGNILFEIYLLISCLATLKSQLELSVIEIVEFFLPVILLFSVIFIPLCAYEVARKGWAWI